MKTASIISIGNELLNGHTVNNNAVHLCEKLICCGIPVTSIHTVSDNISEIVKALNRASEDADFIICTGGLGPTGDDLTRHGLAEFAGAKLQLDEESLKDIENYFDSINRQMPQINKIQAYFPDGAAPIKNTNGTAPGIRFETKGKLIFALPGVPSEMKQMVEQAVLSELKGLVPTQKAGVRKLKCFGIGESKIAELLGTMMDRDRNPLVNTTVHDGVITIHISAVAESKAEAQQMVCADEEKVSSLIGENIFGKDEENLAEVVGKILRERQKTVATAESCTGGLVAKLLTDIPGSSDYFKYGWIVYSNEAKVKELDVSPDIIKQYGAVSEQVAKALALEARNKANADFGIGITGIAGPDGGSVKKPVGLVFIGLSGHNDSLVERFIFRGERSSIRLRASLNALNMLRLKLRI